MITVKVNGVNIEIDSNATALQACELAGIEIPRFCFHERLSIAGNCRMCLVEIEKSPKPQASCSLPVMQGMKIYTDTPLVRKAREAVLEFLLINHPLDCPICDQGGECDLQDQVINYGSDRSRFYEYKRGVENKNVGPLIKMIMTRCIHCTRCVRFMDEVAGVGDFGTTGRGNSTEIGTYIQKNITSELSGNIVDLCPVGALTSKPYSFIARPWELTSVDSIDVMDGVGSNIRIDSRGPEVVRILPRCNEEINEEWISDKTRHACDGLKRQRLDTPMIRDVENNLIPCSWEIAFKNILDNLKSNNINYSFGSDVDINTIATIKNLSILNLKNKIRNIKYSTFTDIETNFKFNTTIQGIEKSDLCLLIGVNPRLEASIINARIWKQVSKGVLEVAFIGSGYDSQSLTYKTTHLGNSLNILKELIKGKHWYCSKLKRAKNPIIIYGSSVINNNQGLSYIKMLQELSKYLSCTYNMLHSNITTPGQMILGLSSYNLELKKSSFVWSINESELDDSYNKDEQFIVYQGNHGNSIAEKASVILPACAYTEKQSYYVNTEGRIQQTARAVNAPGLARLDSQIIMAFYIYCSVNNSNDYKKNLSNLCLDYTNIKNIIKWVPNIHNFNLNLSVPKNYQDFDNTYYPGLEQPLTNNIIDFYQTDNISRNSSIMADCSTMLVTYNNFV